MECKQNFLQYYFSEYQLSKALDYHRKKDKERKELMKILKEKGVSFGDYLREQIKKDGLIGKEIFKKDKNTVIIETADDDWGMESIITKFMGNMRFNEDGSIKIPELILKSKQEEKESIVLRRVQINRNNPAIAHLRIEFPEDIKNPKEITSYYDEIRDKRYLSVEHNIKQIDKRTFIVEVRNGSKYMYSLLDYLLECFESKLGKDKSVVVRGSWDKFSSF